MENQYREIRLKIWGDVPLDVVGILMTDLPKQGVTTWTFGNGKKYAALKHECKTEVYDIYEDYYIK